MLGSEGAKNREKPSCSYCFWLQQHSSYFLLSSKLGLFIYYNSVNELNIKPIQIFKDRHVLSLNTTFLFLFKYWKTFFFLV